MSCPFTLFLAFYVCTVGDFCYAVNFETLHFENQRKLLSEVKSSSSSNNTRNVTKETKNISNNSLRDGESVAGTEAAVLIIVVIVVLSVIGMVIYFIRKFDQLNRALPTYRYSSLKTEINGVYGPNDKVESQALVNVSTEEEDDYDDDDDEGDEDVSPPTLLVRSQTVMTGKAVVNGSIPVSLDNGFISPGVVAKSEEGTMDSDDELLQ